MLPCPSHGRAPRQDRPPAPPADSAVRSDRQPRQSGLPLLAQDQGDELAAGDPSGALRPDGVQRLSRPLPAGSGQGLGRPEQRHASRGLDRCGNDRQGSRRRAVRRLGAGRGSVSEFGAVGHPLRPRAGGRGLPTDPGVARRVSQRSRPPLQRSRHGRGRFECRLSPRGLRPGGALWSRCRSRKPGPDGRRQGTPR